MPRKRAAAKRTAAKKTRKVRNGGALWFQTKERRDAAGRILRSRKVDVTKGQHLNRPAGLPTFVIYSPRSTERMVELLELGELKHPEQGPARRKFVLNPRKRAAKKATAKKARKKPAKRTYKPKAPATKKAARKRAPAKKARKRNPETAAAMYEQFHGRAPKRISTIEYTEQAPSEVADCGKLLQLDVYIDRDRKVSEIEPRGNVRLLTTPDGGQLYFFGGDQSLDLKAIGLARQLPKDHITIGPVAKIHYLTSKHFHKFEPVHYHHKFGEKNGDLPTLNYDTRNKRLYLTGGSYQVRPEGIVN